MIRELIRDVDSEINCLFTLSASKNDPKKTDRCKRVIVVAEHCCL